MNVTDAYDTYDTWMLILLANNRYTSHSNTYNIMAFYGPNSFFLNTTWLWYRNIRLTPEKQRLPCSLSSKRYLNGIKISGKVQSSVLLGVGNLTIFSNHAKKVTSRPTLTTRGETYHCLAQSMVGGSRGGCKLASLSRNPLWIFLCSMTFAYFALSIIF